MDLPAALRRCCTRTATKLPGAHKRNTLHKTLLKLVLIASGPAWACAVGL